MMETPTLTKNFKRAFKKLSVEDATEFRERMMKLFGWSTQTFYNKKNGIRNLTIEESDKVETLFRLMGLDAWTGDKLI